MLIAAALLVTMPFVAAQPATVFAHAQDRSPTVTDHVVESFDGTLLEATLFLPPGATAEAPVPLVLRTHGWAGSRQTGADSPQRIDPGTGTGTLARLVAEGYAVLTWDQRGFGCSGGQVRMNDPDVEGRDVTALIDWAVANAPIATDEVGDPIVGMSGGSYAGSIQTAAAAVDPRIDALAPEISWSDLRYSLYSGAVANQGWVAVLYGSGTATGSLLGLDPSCARGPNADALDPAIHQGVSEFLTTGHVSKETLAFLARSSLASYGLQRPVTVPTLVLQGSVDTLFDLTDGHGIYTHVRDQGVEARFVAFCGGHLACPASYVDAGDRAYLDEAIVAWFARHLRGLDVATGAPVSYRTNEGVWRDADEFAAPAGVALSGAATGLPVVPVVDVPDVEEVAALVAAGPATGIPPLPFTAARPARPGDPRAATFPVARADGGPLEVRGVPHVTLTVSGVTVGLDEAMAPLGALAGTLPNRRVGEVLVGSLGPLGSLTGGVVTGVGGGGPLGGTDGTVNVFVKLVHREAGEVLNLQEGAIRVDLSQSEVAVDVPMPGLAYTLPDGDHLDLEVSTASLMHATGRTPALIDVAVAGSVPIAGAAAPLEPPAPEPPDHPPPPGASAPGPARPAGELPATGGGVPGLALPVLLAGAGARWCARGRTALRRRPTLEA